MPANASKRLPHLPANLSVPDATSHKGSDFAWDNEHLEHFASLSVFELLSGKVHPDDLCGTLMLRIAPHVVHNELWRRFNALYERLNLRTISTHAVSKRWQKALEFLHPDKAEYDAKCKEIRDARTKLRAHGFKAQDKPPSGGCNDGRRSRQQEERAKNKAREKTVPPTASGVSKATTTSSKQSASSKTLPSASPEVGNASTAARDLQPPTKRAKTQKAPEAQLAGGDVETRTTSPTQPRSTAHRLQLPGSQATPMAFTIPGLQGANKQNDPEVQKLNDDEELPQYQPKNTPDLSARDQARIAVLQAEIFERMEEVGRQRKHTMCLLDARMGIEEVLRFQLFQTSCPG